MLAESSERFPPVRIPSAFPSLRVFNSTPSGFLNSKFSREFMALKKAFLVSVSKESTILEDTIGPWKVTRSQFCVIAR